MLWGVVFKKIHFQRPCFFTFMRERLVPAALPLAQMWSGIALRLQHMSLLETLLQLSMQTFMKQCFKRLVQQNMYHFYLRHHPITTSPDILSSLQALIAVPAQQKTQLSSTKRLTKPWTCYIKPSQCNHNCFKLLQCMLCCCRHSWNPTCRWWSRLL